ncbi:MAG: flagellar filament capping protein FliD [Sphingomonas sp.]|uniref:flagellar filament capping protein FliD n=1 Tax=Sphingomonas sp. TaxID=28214 RepID=UPI00261C0630|nr:flagellar filament capping protein FliD [Sphingomonas sp.]MDK2767802.1 flagellar filament capping protein FliD [Sphingomonas sp.]
MAIESIAKTIGTGSGIDTTALVQSLVDAQFELKNAALTKREETLTAQITAAATHKSNITGFATALANLTRGGTLATQPTTSHSSILGVTRLSGANLATLNAKVEVRQLAAPQSAASAAVTDRTAAIGQGTLTLTFGTATVADGAMAGFTAGSAAPVAITIGPDNSSLDGIAAAINAAKAGITASVVTDSGGARLVVKGASGEARAFTLTATETAGHEGLAALNVGIGATGTTIGSAAADAIVAVDGIALRRDGNSISDLVPGVRLDLSSAQPGTIVTIGKAAPTSALLQAAQDFVATYNEVFSALNKDLDPLDGALRGDAAAKAVKRQLQQITIAQVATGAAGEPTTLAQIGIRTERDGTLSVDTAALSRALVDYPEAVERLFAEPVGTNATGNGIAGALNAISATAASTTRGLGASEASYTRAKADLDEDKADVLAKVEDTRTRMTRQFASMDAKVAVYKSTMSFLESQVEAWNKQN